MTRTDLAAPGLCGRRRAAGFSLVELMTAMLLSLLLIAATVSVFVSNKRVYGAAEGLGRIQESGRIAFELMARDIREAGGNPCDTRMKMVNVLANTTDWWATFDADTDTGIFGFDDGGLTGSAAGTDAVQIQFFEDTGLVTSAGMGGTTGNLTVDDIDKITDQQILMACGFFPSTPTEPVTDTAAIFSAGKSGSAITHAASGGNASDDFTDGTHPTPVVFPANAMLGRLRAMEWYVAENAQGGNSLFRRQLSFPGTAPVMGDAEEVVDDVTDLQLTYFEAGAWTDTPTSWNAVTAVQVVLELEESDSRAGGVEGQLIKRKMTNVIALRNKL
ncbi:MAG TPA: prepilin-type N-terminal cleavage/methylation domain-containing protein [Steroidobacteraceae bacterium]|nr:prepilin-type N-terminal cleavage/methylation domain-containing protein [Steroidobacteraceae bacterium]